MILTGKISQCKHQAEYDAYAQENNIYSANQNWDIDVAKLAKFIRENNLKSSEITEDIINDFKIA